MDQGIIRSFKAKYRKVLLQFILIEADKGIIPVESTKKVNLLDAIYWIKNEWSNTTEESIQNCFRKSGFALNSMKTDDQADDLTSSINELYIGANLENSMNLNLTEFLSFDDSLNCNSTLVFNSNLEIDTKGA